MNCRPGPVTSVVDRKAEVRVYLPVGRHLADRQHDVLDINAGLTGVDHVDRTLYAVHTGIEQTLTPGHHMAPGLDAQTLAGRQFEVGEDVGIQKAAAAAGIFLRIAGELIVVAVLVDGTGGAIVITP